MSQSLPFNHYMQSRKNEKKEEKVMFVCQIKHINSLTLEQQRHLTASARTKKRMLSQEHYTPGVCKKDQQKNKTKNRINQLCTYE